jgi:hypothetical protein
MRRLFEILLALATLTLLIWPALVNGYPLLYPDTLDYLGTGHAALFALIHQHYPAFSAVRSAVYAAGIYLFHWNRTLWPILALNAAAVVFPMYLVTRSLVKRDAWRKTLAILATLSILTGLSWYTSFLMPDIFGAPLYLAIYLFAFARETLRPAEQIALVALAVFGATAHSSHLLLAMCLCAMLWLLWLMSRVRRSSTIMCMRSLGVTTAVIMGAIFLQLGVNQHLYGHASLTGVSPPYLEARILADGTGARYLQEHCAEHPQWVLCHHLDNLPADADSFLWSETGIWSSSPAEQAQLRREEMPLILATFRTYPRQQVAVSLNSFWGQLASFELDDFDNNAYMQAYLNAEIPNARVTYDRSLQARSAMPESFFTIVQEITVLASLLLIAIDLRCILRSSGVLRNRLLALTGVILFVVVANAFVSGVLSVVDSRYQARIVWLVPLLAAFYLLELPIFAPPVE